MNSTVRSAERVIWVGVLLTIVLLLLAALLAATKLKQARAGNVPLPVLGQVSDFVLTNQSGKTVTLADLKGHVWVADIIFTRCAGPCPRMTRQMQQVQATLPNDSNARLVSLTTDPKFDTPPVLEAYAKKFGARTDNWLFLTGGPQEIARLAIDSLKLTAVEKKPSEQQSPQDLFIHSTIFVVVDKAARLRGVFETEVEGVSTETVRKRVLTAVKRLEREP
jgi:cytochrome oxidase Cu insertion factor (SCO1/SenC/PrrC family)